MDSILELLGKIGMSALTLLQDVETLKKALQAAPEFDTNESEKVLKDIQAELDK